jgi:hypothetical protein
MTKNVNFSKEIITHSCQTPARIYWVCASLAEAVVPMQLLGSHFKKKIQGRLWR